MPHPETAELFYTSVEGERFSHARSGVTATHPFGAARAARV
jgi:hypothetical protein